MGAGAGYNIKGTIDANSIKINSFEVEEPYFTDGEDNVFNFKYQIIPIKCDIDCKAEDVISESYYDGGTLHGLTPIKITEMSLIPYSDDIEDISEITEDIIWYALRDLKFDVLIGGGWSHHTFDGDISCDGDDLKEDSYSDFYFNEIIMHITNDGAIEALDTYAAGDNYSEEYRVTDEDGDTIDYFDDFDEAVEYAIGIDAYQVLPTKTWYEYYITDSGDIETDILDEDDDFREDWTNPNYIEE
jgi:hypothetical protein